MCGIFAYLGDREALPCLITALKRLEYRGYDSAGVGVHNGKHINICKKIGKVVNLETACGGVNNPEYAGTMGIAHTRWATHGAPTDANAHPHFTEDRKVAVVHNGIIENYASLREELINKGYHFTSETDTELLAHLVADVRKQMGPDPSWSVIVSCALSLVTGAYGVVFMFEDEPDLLIGARKGSPLILGVGEGEYMLASDGSAVVEYTKDVVFIRDGELVEVRKSGYRLRTIEGISTRQVSIDEDVTNPLVQLEVSLEQIEKGGYPHFMIKEIMDQPNCIRNTCRGRLYQPMQEHDSHPPPKWDIRLGGLNTKVQGTEKTALEAIAGADRIIICACGTSWHSGLIGEYLIESLARINVEVEYASEFRYRNPLLTPKDVVVAISQSGETADTLEAIRIAKSNGALSIGIVNCVGSTIARDTDAGIYLHAGPEIGVASTKAFTSQVMVLTLLALNLARNRGTIEEEYFCMLCEELHCFPEYISRVLKTATQIKTISKFFRMAQNFLFLGRGIHFPVALEGALKLKEISYIHAEGYPAAEMKHGPIALIDRLMPVVCIAPKSDPTYDKVKANIEEVKARNGELIIITEEGNHDLDRFVSDKEYIIRIPSVDVNLQPIIAVIPLQLLSYYIADLRGCSIDQPRNLAKSVTALKRLEYRGYDSAGVGIHNGKELKIAKKVGKVANLEAYCGGVNNPEYAGTMGIAHTRWATHGAPTDANAHPHFTEDRKVAVVHNGIIENYASLREELINKGYHFTSETDTELLAHLVADVRKQMGPDPSWSVIVSCALSLVTGAYGVVFMFEDEPDLLIGARKGSPLILGVGDGEYMLASDASAVVEYTKDVVYIRDGELVEVRRSGYRLRSIDAISTRQASVDEDIQNNPLVQLELNLEQIEKGGYPHFMLKEIMDQPHCLENSCRGRLYRVNSDDTTHGPNAISSKWGIRLGGLDTTVRGTDQTALDAICGADRIIICACGTSWHSGLIGEYLIESLARINVEVEYASEFRYRNPLLTPKDVVIVISQSGETADTLEAVRIAKEYGALSIGIVNTVGSTIARDTDAGIYLHAGPEIGVASTKAFTSQVMVLTLLALRLALARGTIDTEYFDTLCDQLSHYPETIQRVLKLNSQVKNLSRYFRLASNFLFLGRGIHYPVALEGALKLKEISYIHAEGYPAAEMKHGPIALIDRMMPVVCIAPKSDPTYDKVKANIEEVKARNGDLLIITEEGNHDLDKFAGDKDFVIRVPTVDIVLQPIVTTIPLQMLSYYVADLRGCSIDQPRNLAKSVTVE